MGRLIDRLREKGLVGQQPHSGYLDEEEISRKYAKLLEELVQLEDEVARRYRLFAQVVLDTPVPQTTNEQYQELVKDIRAQAYLDRQENILYVLWMRERLTNGPIDLELEEFSEVVAGRAVVRLLHYVPRGEELLASLDRSSRDWIPPKDAVRRFVLSGGLLEQDPQRFLARLFAEVPNSRRALYKLLAAYKAVVEVEAERSKERYPGVLPGQDLRRRAVVTWDLLAQLLGVGPQEWEERMDEARKIEFGVQLYQMGLSVNDAAKLAGTGREFLTEVLRDRGLLRRPGRPRRYRSIGDLLAEESVVGESDGGGQEE